MKSQQTTIPSDDASVLLKRLCKHFRHKVPAEWDSHHGRVEFKPGLCLMAASEKGLDIYCEAESAQALEEVRMVVEIHVQRMARHENLEIVWKET